MFNLNVCNIAYKSYGVYTKPFLKTTVTNICKALYSSDICKIVHP